MTFACGEARPARRYSGRSLLRLVADPNGSPFVVAYAQTEKEFQAEVIARAEHRSSV